MAARLTAVLTPLMELIVTKMIATVEEPLEEMIVQKIEEMFTLYQLPDGAVIEVKFTDKLTAIEITIEKKTKRIAYLEDGIEAGERRIEEMDDKGRLKSLMIYGVPEMDYFNHTQESTAESKKAKTVTSGRLSVNSVKEDLELAWKKQRFLTCEDFVSKVAIIRAQYWWNSRKGLLENKKLKLSEGADRSEPRIYIN